MEHDPFGPDDAASTPPEAMQRACERVLARLVPPLVHRLNNLVMQAVGRLELISEPGGETPDRVREPLFELTSRLRLLTLFSRRLSTAERIEDLFDNLGALLEPLASERGVAFVRMPLALGALSSPVSLESALLTLAARELIFVAGDEVLAPRNRRVRLRATPGAEGTVVLCLTTAPLTGRSEDAERRCQDVLAGCLGPEGLEVRFRSIGGARSVRLIAPATVTETLPRPQPGPRILLYGQDEVWLEILAEVLDEAGFRVSLARTPGELGELSEQRAFDLRLADGSCLADEPELLSALRQATSADDAGKIGVVGGQPVSGERIFHFAGKLVPAPFLEFVNACLTTT